MVSVAGLVGKNIKASALELKGSDLVNNLRGISLLRDEGTLGVGEGEDGGAKFHDFECSVLSNISRARYGDEGGRLVEAEFRAILGNHLGILKIKVSSCVICK